MSPKNEQGKVRVFW